MMQYYSACLVGRIPKSNQVSWYIPNILQRLALLLTVHCIPCLLQRGPRTSLYAGILLPHCSNWASWLCYSSPVSTLTFCINVSYRPIVNNNNNNIFV